MAEIVLTDGCIVTVDESDFEWLSQEDWQCDSHKYAHIAKWVDGKTVTIKMHRMILNAAAGTFVDHKDRNGMNNQRCNLRFATRSQNQMNKKQAKHSTSPFKGVKFCPKKKSKKWHARITVDGRRMSLGYYESAEAAFCAYRNASLLYHADFSIYAE